MRNIRRVDHEASGTPCWRVTVQRRTRVFVRTFSDRHHGGAQQALEAAQLIETASSSPISRPWPCRAIVPSGRKTIARASLG
jgi:hypothetical protein